jgi:DNA-binding NarL/FixJ family response regulator
MSNCAPSSSTPARVLIVDDHPLVREGLGMLIQTDPGLVLAGEAGNGAEARAAMASCKPDIVLLDLALPDVGGIDLISDLRHDHPTVPILVLSMHEETVYSARALLAGASGYLMKLASARVIAEAIRTVLQGGTAFSDAVSQTAPFQALYRRRGKGRHPPAKQGMDSLSNRELQIFDAIGSARSTPQIAAALGLSEKTVETHRAHIKRKLGLATAAALTHEAFRWVETETLRKRQQDVLE